jgi:hypothetical protein
MAFFTVALPAPAATPRAALHSACVSRPTAREGGGALTFHAHGAEVLEFVDTQGRARLSGVPSKIPSQSQVWAPKGTRRSAERVRADVRRFSCCACCGW